MWRNVESLVVPCSGETVISTTTLRSTTPYRLRATGRCVANTFNSSRADAEYAGWGLIGGPSDAVDGIDVGLAVDQIMPGPSKQPRWGAARSDHVYEVPWTGADRAITARFHDPNYTNNSGSLTLTILAYE
jgi:hypothetical protein